MRFLGGGSQVGVLILAMAAAAAQPVDEAVGATARSSSPASGSAFA